MRKAALRQCKRPEAPPLQWGRTLSSAESFTGQVETEERLQLQWGRTLSSAERKHQTRRIDMLEGSFNGAALFQVRKGDIETSHDLQIR